MKLEDLKSEQRVLGVEPAGAVTILYVKIGTDSAEIAYQGVIQEISRSPKQRRYTRSEQP